MQYKLKIIIGSTRPGRVGKTVADWFTLYAKENSTFLIEVLDLAEINLPFLDEPNHPRLRKYTKQHTKDWSTKIEDGDAFVFITPEYDYSAPPTIINAIDYLNQEWQHKPVGIVSYGGISGGLRSAQMLKLIITAVNMMPLSEGVAIPFVSGHINENEVLEDTEKIEHQAKAMLTKLELWTKHLKNLHLEWEGIKAKS